MISNKLVIQDRKKNWQTYVSSCKGELTLLQQFPLTRSSRRSLPGLKKLWIEVTSTFNSLITVISRKNERGYISRVNYGHQVLNSLQRCSTWRRGKACLQIYTVFIKTDTEEVTFVLWSIDTLYKKFKAGQVWSLYRDITPRKNHTSCLLSGTYEKYIFYLKYLSLC